ncbi:hypothetical protein [Mesorhizobium sp.]|uniref:hypothetical protein n=1 Tax=Mesorhizobium sp. TaxID=1871066 RepID=UPI000FE58011|nr:hypothetical protein [Mesorhizobium sp.]RWO53699.1 MAG: hypothetical protein EOS13_10175 [Mesorhizobium sp.]TIN27063.1 MAG: hypothetical protein E5Y19_10990 [Mesorhizobium sp.]TIN41639.1 MAG: hypothetical protein E5Y13_07165 [Mesorhizobium sp.]TJU88525.1 MAG: hypothetical protein E5Y10_16010 [Mesorhizobium sp.]TJU88948.1 MAG: hypothetical protein E5Y15_04845 [Mesorhizobium sp.]
MHILSIKPEPPGLGGVIARFDIALSDELRLFGLRLTERAAGGHAVYAANTMGRRSATFSPNLVEQISRAALAALKELKPHDRNAD